LSLLQTYISGSYVDSTSYDSSEFLLCVSCEELQDSCRCRNATSASASVARGSRSDEIGEIDKRNVVTRESRKSSSIQQQIQAPQYRRDVVPERDFSTFSDSDSDLVEETPVYNDNRDDYSNVRYAYISDNPLDEMETVFDIVFKQQSIGMKLGSDPKKQYAMVKECFEGSEASRYPEIESGVVILAVNGQEVSGLGLSRILYRLREAPRPVVVRFGRMRQEYHQHSSPGTWG
jgi:C-terminal processing protease CtpA/Prc